MDTKTRKRLEDLIQAKRKKKNKLKNYLHAKNGGKSGVVRHSRKNAKDYKPLVHDTIGD
jgi:hypothetical protein